MILRTIRQIFDIKKKLVEKSWTYKLNLSIYIYIKPLTSAQIEIEIYNEKVRDLLNLYIHMKIFLRTVRWLR